MFAGHVCASRRSGRYAVLFSAMMGLTFGASAATSLPALQLAAEPGLADGAKSSIDLKKEQIEHGDLLSADPMASERAIGIRDSYGRCMDRAGSDLFSVVVCSNVEFDYQDTRLNAVYQKVMRSLSGSRRDELRTEEREWVAAKDAFCGSSKPAGMVGRAIIASCFMFETAARATVLDRMTTNKATLKPSLKPAAKGISL